MPSLRPVHPACTVRCRAWKKERYVNSAAASPHLSRASTSACAPSAATSAAARAASSSPTWGGELHRRLQAVTDRLLAGMGCYRLLQAVTGSYKLLESGAGESRQATSRNIQAGRNRLLFRVQGCIVGLHPVADTPQTLPNFSNAKEAAAPHPTTHLPSQQLHLRLSVM